VVLAFLHEVHPLGSDYLGIFAMLTDHEDGRAVDVEIRDHATRDNPEVVAHARWITGASVDRHGYAWVLQVGVLAWGLVSAPMRGPAWQRRLERGQSRRQWKPIVGNGAPYGCSYSGVFLIAEIDLRHYAQI
jgi:hypothetical protein